MIVIYDYQHSPCTVNAELDDENIISAIIFVVSGDEILLRITKDGELLWFDSNLARIMDFYDGSYCIKNENNILVTEEWFKETSPYARLHMMGGDK